MTSVIAPTVLPSAPGRIVPRYAQTAILRTILIAGGLATLVLWWVGTKTGVAPGVGGAFTALGQLTGLVGGYLLLVEVALMARTPWLEQRIGTDRVASWHRSLGEYTVIMLSSHAVLLILGASLSLRRPVITTASTIIFDYPDVLKATIATVLLIGIGVLSAKAIRRRLRYETWHATHVLGYLVLFLGYSHQISVGSSMRDPVVRAIWLGLHLSVAAAVVWWRVAVPVRLHFRHSFKVAAVVREGPQTVSIIVTGQRLDKLAAEPGQFFRWRFMSAGAWWQAHPFSLSAAPTADGLRITVKALGDHSAALAKIRRGTPVLVEGPYGAITPRMLGGGRRLLLIGGGVGVTPLRALLDAVPASPVGQRPNAALIQRVNRADELLFDAELAELARTRRVELFPLVGAPNRVRLDAAKLRSLVPDLSDREIVLCGPPGMVAATLAALGAAGVPTKQIHVEQFAF